MRANPEEASTHAFSKSTQHVGRVPPVLTDALSAHEAGGVSRTDGRGKRGARDRGRAGEQRAPASMRLSRSWSRAWFVKHITTIGPTSSPRPPLSTSAATAAPPSPFTPPSPTLLGSPKRGLRRRPARPAGFLMRARDGFAVGCSACGLGASRGTVKCFWNHVGNQGVCLRLEAALHTLPHG